MKRLFVIISLLVATGAFALDFARESELQNACDHNDGTACLELGSMYHLGNGVSQSFSRARLLYMQACTLGFANGCTHLGFMYENGHAGRDLAKAAELYEKACVLGDASGCESLAVAYENGSGVREDLQQAVNYYDRACSGGSKNSCAHLALLYEQAENEVYAAIYHQNGCDAGDAKACSAIAARVYHGKGVAQNHEKALSLFKRACELGDETGCKNYERIKNPTWFQ